MKTLSLGSKPDLFPPYLFKELDRRKKEELKKGKDVISLAIGDPDLPTPASVVNFAARAIKKASNHCYPDGKGSQELRRAIAAWHKRRHGITLDPETEILALIGSKEGLAHLPLALVDAGDTVLIPDPAYPAYKTGAIFSGAKIKRVPLREEKAFLPDLDAIPASDMRRAKMMFLNYPNNPTGASADASFYSKAVRFASRRGLWLAQDAAYSEIFYGKPTPSILSVPGARKLAVEFYSLSKTYCMTGWRLAWVIGNAAAIGALSKLKENMDSGQFGAVQDTAVFCLENHDKLVAPIKRRFRDRIEMFCAGLKAAGWHFYRPQASFFVWARPPAKTKSIDAVYRMLSEVSVLPSPGSGFGPSGEGFVRFSLCAPEKRIEDAVKRISRMKW